jgi:hypothetical protein
MAKPSTMSRTSRVILWATVTLLGVFMLGRGIWALQQPWGATGQKMFGFAFFAALTAFSAYRLLIVAVPAGRLGDAVIQNVAYGIVSLIFVAGALFLYFHESLASRWIAVAGTLFFGGGAVVFFARARHLQLGKQYSGKTPA